MYRMKMCGNDSVCHSTEKIVSTVFVGQFGDVLLFNLNDTAQYTSECSVVIALNISYLNINC